ncbi:MAG TPA: Arm DNA-binding domain-containing protein [Puia sp.]|nr:Arm DNA-binding domain-containing protein [Puia sp.]
MQTRHSFGIDFLIRKCKEDKNRALIYLRITVDGERKEVSTKESIEVKDWDSKKEIVLYGGSTADSLSHFFPVDDSTYMDGYDLGRVVFGRDAQGKVTHYTFIRYDGQRIRIPKIK